jgi:hypothetical protein
MPIVASFARWLETRDWAMDFAGSAYFYPIVLATHLTCIAIFGGMILITNLRLLGWCCAASLCRMWWGGCALGSGAAWC